MKAAIWTKYGPPDALQLQEVEKPTPGDNELLIRIHATTVTMGDCELRRFRPITVFLLPMRIYAGLIRPTRLRILGQELAGVVEATGKDVTLFKEGDPVFAATGFNLGAYAEYTCLPQDGTVVNKPANLTYEEAAAVPLGGLEACQYLRPADIQPRQSVLVNGAGGSIGTIAVQLARYYGAEVTAVDSSDKLDMLRAIGANHTVDYTLEDFTQRGQTYDLIFDVVGSSSPDHSKRALKPNGRYLTANPGSRQQLRGLWNLIARRDEIMAQYTGSRRENLLFLKERLEAEDIEPVIDRTYPLAQIAEAHRYVETGRKKGSVIIEVGA